MYQSQNILKTALLFGVCVGSLWACAPDEQVPHSPEYTCYQEKVGNGPQQDVTVLTLTRDGEHVEGVYHWLPAFKDQRVGDFRGERTEAGLRVDYTYQQEGTAATTTLLLTPSAEHIQIEGGEPALGLAQTLSRVKCSSLVELPDLSVLTGQAD